MRAVSSGWRGRGIATSLLSKAVSYLRAEGAKKVYSEIETDNKAIAAACMKLGFKTFKTFRKSGLHWQAMAAEL